MLGDEVSESTDKSLRSIEKKIDDLANELRLVNQRLELYDVESIKRANETMRNDITELKANARVGAALAAVVLAAVVLLVFRVFSQGAAI